MLLMLVTLSAIINLVSDMWKPTKCIVNEGYQVRLSSVSDSAGVYSVKVALRTDPAVSILYSPKHCYDQTLCAVEGLILMGHHENINAGDARVVDVFRLRCLSSVQVASARFQACGLDRSPIRPLAIETEQYMFSISNPLHDRHKDERFSKRNVISVSASSVEDICVFECSRGGGANQEGRLRISRLLPKFDKSRRTWGQAEVLSEEEMSIPFTSQFTPITLKEVCFFLTERGLLFRSDRLATGKHSPVDRIPEMLPGRVRYLFSTCDTPTRHYVVGVHEVDKWWYCQLGQTMKPKLFSTQIVDSYSDDGKISEVFRGIESLEYKHKPPVLSFP